MLENMNQDNYNKIKNMNFSELASFLAESIDCCICKRLRGFDEHYNDCSMGGNCREAIEKWLLTK